MNARQPHPRLPMRQTSHNGRSSLPPDIADPPSPYCGRSCSSSTPRAWAIYRWHTPDTPDPAVHPSPGSTSRCSAGPGARVRRCARSRAMPRAGLLPLHDGIPSIHSRSGSRSPVPVHPRALSLYVSFPESPPAPRRRGRYAIPLSGLRSACRPASRNRDLRIGQTHLRLPPSPPTSSPDPPSCPYPRCGAYTGPAPSAGRAPHTFAAAGGNPGEGHNRGTPGSVPALRRTGGTGSSR